MFENPWCKHNSALYGKKYIYFQIYFYIHFKIYEKRQQQKKHTNKQNIFAKISKENT